MRDSNIKTIDIIRENFREKLLKDVNRQFNVISSVRITFVVNDVQIINQFFHTNVNL